MATHEQSTPKPNVLDADQRARRECLMAARNALAATNDSGAFSKGGGVLPEHRSIDDLLNVARYVETGEHPSDRDAKAVQS